MALNRPEEETRRTVTVVIDVPVTYFPHDCLTHGPAGWEIDELIVKLGYRVARVAELKAQSDWDHQETERRRESEICHHILVDLP